VVEAQVAAMKLAQEKQDADGRDDGRAHESADCAAVATATDFITHASVS
jgi:hypothetical protein